MANQTLLTVDNPFDTGGSGAKAPGYIDLVGVINAASADSIDAYETGYAEIISKQKAARRSSLTDTDNNSVDFISVDYRTSGAKDWEVDAWKPRGSNAGSWDPFAEPEEPAAAPELLIFQIYGTGPNTQDGSVSHTFVELYNNSDTAVNLGAYSLQYADGISSSASIVSPWTKIDLTGTIPAHSSYLIRGGHKNTENGTVGRLQVAAPDRDVPDFTLSNRSYKVALMSNQTLLTVDNPFDAGDGGTKAAGYVDLAGVINSASDADSIDAYETAYAEIISKQKSARRNSLVDTDNNSADFQDIDFRTANLEKYRPRNTDAGAWTPEF
jgi:ribosomal protein L20A (L18A)